MDKNNNTKVVSMSIDLDLFDKSELLISHRTKDYEEYLSRRIYTGTSSQLVRMEIDDLDKRREELMNVYNFKVKLEDGLDDNIINQNMDKAVETVTNIISNEKSIGQAKLKDIADINNVFIRDLKAALSPELQSKITEYHPEIKTKPGTMR